MFNYIFHLLKCFRIKTLRVYGTKRPPPSHRLLSFKFPPPLPPSLIEFKELCCNKTADLESEFIYLWLVKCVRENSGFYLHFWNVWTTKPFCLSKMCCCCCWKRCQISTNWFIICICVILSVFLSYHLHFDRSMKLDKGESEKKRKKNQCEKDNKANLRRQTNPFLPKTTNQNTTRKGIVITAQNPKRKEKIRPIRKQLKLHLNMVN